MTLNRQKSLENDSLSVISEDELEIKWDFLEQSIMGDGGFANVYHVFYNGYDAVLKKSKAKEFTEKDRQEMLREAMVVAALNNCQNVIRLYGICESPTFRGLIMEYCAGPNLSELVFQLYERSVKMETLRVYKWCYELTRTLCDLNLTHFHGDLKPQNVQVKERPCCCQEPEFDKVSVREQTYFLCKSCRGVHLEHISLKILDFGMSYRHGTRRKYMGTPKFAAPETITGDYTEKSEVYSFGLLMLGLVIGKPTEECHDEQVKFLKLRNNPQFDLSRCKSNSICETVTECTHNSPEFRPTFRQLLDKLNSRVDQYTSLRSDDSRSKANLEREEFLDHYKISRTFGMVHRTVTTSTFLSTSTENSISSEAEKFGGLKFYGGPLDNDVFVDSPCSSMPTSRRNSESASAALVVVNPLYTDDEWMDEEDQVPAKIGTKYRVLGSTKTRKNLIWRVLIQTKNVISDKINKIMNN